MKCFLLLFIQSPDVQYEGDVMSSDHLKQWLSEKCVPLVREITFENGEVAAIRMTVR